MTTLLFAGGGTGGHVFPMVAVADAVRDVAPDLRLVFVGTPRGIEARVIPERGYELHLLEVAPLRGGGVGGALRGAVRAARAVAGARKLVRGLGPAAVFSAGGYAAGPVALAARTLGVPVALMEPNSAIGLANRLIAPFVQRAYTAFEGTERHFARATVLRTGVPLRKGFEPRPYRHRSGALGVLVLGGSQGAQTLNDAVPRALARVARPVRVVHQAGGGRDAGVRALYGELGLSAEVLPFIDDMPAALTAADLVIGRAGASAVAEVCAVGRPAIFVPYPHAGDHQKHNARAVADASAAVCLLNAEATVERLAAEVDRLAAEPNALSNMAARARSLGQPAAASVIANDFLRLSGLAAPSESGRRGSAHAGLAALEEAI